MLTKRSIGGWILLSMLPVLAWGQTIVWQLPPTDYDNIEPFGAQLYKVSRQNRVGLISADGIQVIPVEYDEITGFHEGMALVLKNEDGHTLIGGALTEEGEFRPFQKKYFTLKGQAFYSDGMLTVSDERGRKGYLDTYGREEIGFDGRFDIIKPFTEGYASVFKGKGQDKKYALIDKQGEPAQFRLRLGEVYGGTNVFHGKAIIWDTDGKFYTYDTSTSQCSSTHKYKEAVFDYLYCFTAYSGRTRDVPCTTLPNSGKKGLSATKSENGLYGYSYNGMVVLPPQFSAATDFINDVAIVTLGDKKGLLRWIEDDTVFSLNVAESEHSYYAGNKVTCGFELKTPSAWSDKSLNVTVTDVNTGENMNGQYLDGHYTFSFKPVATEKSIHVAVSSDGLQLWSGETIYSFRRLELELQASIVIASDIANKDDQIPVTAIITNPGTESVTADVHMTGSSTFVKKDVTITIPPGGSVNVHSYFHVVKDAVNQSVYVTTSKGGSASKKGLRLESYI